MRHLRGVAWHCITNDTHACTDRVIALWIPSASQTKPSTTAPCVLQVLHQDIHLQLHHPCTEPSRCLRLHLASEMLLRLPRLQLHRAQADHAAPCTAAGQHRQSVCCLQRLVAMAPFLHTAMDQRVWESCRANPAGWPGAHSSVLCRLRCCARRRLSLACQQRRHPLRCSPP